MNLTHIEKRSSSSRVKTFLQSALDCQQQAVADDVRQVSAKGDICLQVVSEQIVREKCQQLQKKDSIATATIASRVRSYLGRQGFHVQSGTLPKEKATISYKNADIQTDSKDMPYWPTESRVIALQSLDSWLQHGEQEQAPIYSLRKEDFSHDLSLITADFSKERALKKSSSKHAWASLVPVFHSEEAIEELQEEYSERSLENAEQTIDFVEDEEIDYGKLVIKGEEETSVFDVEREIKNELLAQTRIGKALHIIHHKAIHGYCLGYSKSIHKSLITREINKYLPLHTLPNQSLPDVFLSSAEHCFNASRLHQQRAHNLVDLHKILHSLQLFEEPENYDELREELVSDKDLELEAALRSEIQQSQDDDVLIQQTIVEKEAEQSVSIRSKQCSLAFIESKRPVLCEIKERDAGTAVTEEEATVAPDNNDRSFFSHIKNGEVPIVYNIFHDEEDVDEDYDDEDYDDEDYDEEDYDDEEYDDEEYIEEDYDEEVEQKKLSLQLSKLDLWTQKLIEEEQKLQTQENWITETFSCQPYYTPFSYIDSQHCVFHMQGTSTHVRCALNNTVSNIVEAPLFSVADLSMHKNVISKRKPETEKVQTVGGTLSPHDHVFIPLKNEVFNVDMHALRHRHIPPALFKNADDCAVFMSAHSHDRSLRAHKLENKVPSIQQCIVWDINTIPGYLSQYSLENYASTVTCC